MMKKRIARTDFYDIDVDEDINRVYIAFKSEWKKLSQVPNYITDIEDTVRHLKSGFTSLSDIAGMKPPSEECHQHIVKSQGMFNDAGMKKQDLIVDKNTMDLIRKSRSAHKELGTD
jgi:hypothetical protein